MATVLWLVKEVRSLPNGTSVDVEFIPQREKITSLEQPDGISIRRTDSNGATLRVGQQNSQPMKPMSILPSIPWTVYITTVATEVEGVDKDFIRCQGATQTGTLPLT